MKKYYMISSNSFAGVYGFTFLFESGQTFQTVFGFDDLGVAHLLDLQTSEQTDLK